MAPPTVTVVVPAYAAARWISECLQSLRKVEYPPDKLEILIVDNESPDDTRKLAKKEGFEPLVCRRRGVSAARNCGIECAGGEIIAFLDTDAVADPDWLVHLVEPFRDPEVAGVGGKIDPYSIETGPEIHARYCHLLDQEKHLAGEPPYMLPFAATANAAYRAAALREVGGFDETFAIGEDADLAWRVQWAGHKLAYAEKARVRHHHRSRRGPYFRQMFSYGEGTAHLFAKHRRRLGRRVWIGWNHFGAMALALLHAPVMPFTAPQPWDRVMPLYDVVSGLFWTAGRIAGAIRHRVLVI
ncbi:MAG TPA: glycosyltransferase [Sumerlaeia bacterium]|nr:glycosyltransferase [Sumerlaeia bacterium]